jgi:hypothetical protein
MVKVKMLVSRAGPTLSQSVGEVVDVDAAEAKRMIDAGQAEMVREGPAPEKATRRAAPEKAAK